MSSRCLGCGTKFDSEAGRPHCPACRWEPEEIGGIAAYAPQFANQGGGFEASYFKVLSELEATNFWFQSRNDLILWALRKYHPKFCSFLEIGCGTGFVLSGVTGKYPEAKIFGSEIFIEGLRFASERLPNARLMQMDARAIPFAEEFDAVGAFDVLEHIEEDETVLQQMHAALKPKGTLLVTVPQHPWLWSPLDDYAHHCRRYTASELNRKVTAAGFTILRNTSFVSFLLPAMLASRLMSRNKSVDEIDVRTEMQLPSLLNNAFRWILRAENALIGTGLDFPLGGSRLLVARKI
ncbi:class I SAM-dependent methyltransferase [Rhizobium hidalgonense]|uniref:class I SAM-dependent methyltransferase n=1 Tax=Rhizobium hidalgonense TaxID=1538159 RepID=UPI0028710EF5|nr:class I SAM-dependent methyltransferase [Rhizobium hidalgonense]MDR9808752.1 class I SAM-dependent methyltransferase [Rhizobium hidalgonense]